MNNKCEVFAKNSNMHLNRKDEITREDIKDFVDKYYNNPLLLEEHTELNENEKRYVIRLLESIHETTMGFGGTLKDKKHTPWLDNERANIEWVDGNFGSKVTMKYPCIVLKGKHSLIFFL